MRIGILGPLQVAAADGRSVDIGGARLRGLLLRLALEPGQVIATARLVDDLWESVPPADPSGALQSLVARLRRALDAAGCDGRATISSHPTGYRLDLSRDAVDAWVFEHRAAEGHAALAAGDPDRAATVLRDALALWRGAPLADANGAAFAVAPTARLEELRLSAIEDRADADLAADTAGGTNGLVAELEELCAAHPLRERLHARLMRALHADGRAADALAVYERIRGALADQLGTDPGTELRDVHTAVLRGDLPVTPRPDAPPAAHEPRSGAADRRSNLPATLTSFVGRDAELDRIDQLLRDARLVTLTGPGGAGKTRLATEAAARLLPATPDGVWLVELAPVTDPAGVTPAVLATLGHRGTDLLTEMVEAGFREPRMAGPTDPLDRLSELLAGRHLLLVLDNCEHLLDAAAQLAGRVLAAAPNVRVLATSREPLSITGEALSPVPPLALPAPDPDITLTPQAALGYPAVALFADRATAVRPGFAVSSTNVGDVVRVCHVLDGIPLAIELAAARLRSLTPAQLAQMIGHRLGDRFRLLDRGSRTAMPRHQTLRAVFDWSWELLDDQERALLRRLSVFTGGATVDAVARVCRAAGPASPAGTLDPDAMLELDATLDLLTALVDKSLVVADERGGDGQPVEVRYRLLETVRDYAAEQLAAAGEADRTNAAHTAWFLELAETAEPKLRTAEQLDWLARLDAEQGNLDAVLSRAVTAGQAEVSLRLVAARLWHWLMRGQRAEAGAAASAAVRTTGGQPAPGVELAHALCLITAVLTSWAEFGIEQIQAGMLPEVTPAVRAALETVERSDHPVALGATVFIAVLSAVAAGDAPDDALKLLQPDARFTGHYDPWVRAATHVFHGGVSFGSGQVSQAEESFAAAVAEFRLAGDRWGLMISLLGLAIWRSMRGGVPEALAAIEEGLAYADEIDMRSGVASMVLAVRGQLRHRAGDPAGAHADLQQAYHDAEMLDDRPAMATVRYHLGEIARIAGDLDGATAHHHAGLRVLEAHDALPRTAPVPQIAAQLHSGIARVELARGHTERAGDLHRRALELAATSRDNPDRATALESFAHWCEAAGEPDRAAAALGAAHALRGTNDASDPELLGLIDRCITALGEERYRAAWDRGHALPQPEKLALPQSGRDGGEGEPSFGTGQLDLRR